MALLEFQTSLGLLVRASDGSDPLRYPTLTPGEHGYLSSLAGSDAFLFTTKVQRSWCAGRAAKAAYLTLSILESEKRDQLLSEWVNSGGGTRSFVGAESAAFLEFIGKHLDDPSHELTICEMEMAALRADEGTQHFECPELSEIDSPHCCLQRGRYAGLVRFYAEPQQVLNALIKREPYPPVSSKITTLLFGPGFDRLHRTASWNEVSLYERLLSAAPAAELLSEGFRREIIQGLLKGGAVEYAEPMTAVP
ncbi:MAG: hypothetical protein LAO55_02925 [Acidobacteriia bacterium]|nr:hypothetical protein [Terriglobia bacterium]